MLCSHIVDIYNTVVHMNKVSITQAAKMARISRSYLYRKYINNGLISVETENEKKFIDISELIRVFGDIHVDSEHVVDKVQCDTSSVDNVLCEKDKLIAHLEQEILELKIDSKQREEWLKLQLEKTTHLLENKQEPEKPKRKKFLGIF
jgi:hypothetical protein